MSATRLSLLVCLLALATSWASPLDATAADVGSSAPAFSLHDENGSVVTLNDFAGTGAILHFCVAWEPTCLDFYTNDLPTLSRSDLVVSILLQNAGATSSVQADAQAWRTSIGSPTTPILHMNGDDAVLNDLAQGYLAGLYEPDPAVWPIPALVFVGPDLSIVGNSLAQPGTSPSALALWNVLAEVAAGAAPRSIAGDDQQGWTGDPIQLDGSQSFDASGQEPLDFAWTITSAPSGSTAMLTDALSSTPGLIPDIAGDYVIELVVTNTGGAPSAPDSLVVSATEPPPPIVLPIMQDQTGQAVDPAEFIAQGGMILDICAAWCGPCQGFYASTYPSLPGKERLYPVLVEGPTQGTTATASDATSWASGFGLDVVVHPDGDAALKAQVLAAVEPYLPEGYTEVPYPTFVFIDPAGRVVGTIAGAPGSDLTEWNALLAQTIEVPPEANAGPDRLAETGSQLMLYGGESEDLAGRPLSYSWTIVDAPPGSTAALSDASADSPVFTPDVVGDYLFRLVVTNDLGLSSTPDHVSVTAVASLPPSPFPTLTTQFGDSVELSEFFADGGVIVDLCAGWCGPCQQFYETILPTIAGRERILTLLLEGFSPGSASTQSDSSTWANVHDLDFVLHVDGDTLTKDQIITAVEPHLPAGVTEVAFPTFVFIDAQGNIVGTVVGLPDFQMNEWNALLAQTFDLPPVAHAGSDRTIALGSAVTLNGGNSSDPAEQALTYAWTIETSPAGSSAAIVGASTENPQLTPDLIGEYQIQLVVENPSATQSQPDSVTVTVVDALPPSPLPDVSTQLGDSLTLSELFWNGGVIIDVCAFWCNPCRSFYEGGTYASISGSDRVHTLLLEGNQPGSTSTQADAVGWADAYGLDTVLHANGDAALKAQILDAIGPHLPGGTGFAFPTFVFIDSNGQVVGTIVGLPDSQMAQWNQYLALLDAPVPVPTSTWASVVLALLICAVPVALFRARLHLRA